MFSLILAAALASGGPLPQAHEFTMNRQFENSIALLANYKPTSGEEYNQQCYLMSINYFSLNDVKNTAIWVTKLSSSFIPMPKRYRVMAIMIEDSLAEWKDGDLSDIKRDMIISSDRLGMSDGGVQTQKIQKQIVDKLDKLIKEQENKQNGKGSSDGSSKKDGKQQQPQGTQPSQPAAESTIMGGGGPGKVDEKKLRQVAAQWGGMSPAQRAKVVEDITKEVPPKYKLLIEQYFKSLNKANP
jgi:hypothetical protein